MNLFYFWILHFFILFGRSDECHGTIFPLFLGLFLNRKNNYFDVVTWEKTSFTVSVFGLEEEERHAPVFSSLLFFSAVHALLFICVRVSCWTIAYVCSDRLTASHSPFEFIYLLILFFYFLNRKPLRHCQWSELRRQRQNDENINIIALPWSFTDLT